MSTIAVNDMVMVLLKDNDLSLLGSAERVAVPVVVVLASREPLITVRDMV